MSIPVILRSEAEDDIQTIYDDLEQARTGLGTRFVARLRESARTNRIDAGTVWGSVAGRPGSAAQEISLCHLLRCLHRPS